MTQAVRHDAMRARNLALVLGSVSARGSLTRAALAEVTGLTKTTVSKLVADLIETGLVVETGAVRGGERGRPGVEVRIRGDRVAALGLEINVDYLAVRVVDLSRSVRLRRTQAVDNRSAQPVDVIARLRDLALSAVDEAVGNGLRIVGGALAVPGPVDLGSGVVHNAPNLGWRDVPVLSLLDLGIPLHVENEANLAALGELWFGSGPTDFLYVSGEIGIGAGLVVAGSLFRGARGFAGELGHVVVSPDGPPCRCGGRGCLEQYAGQDALLGAQNGAPAGGVMTMVGRLKAQDPAATAACHQAGWALGVALSSTVNLVDPDTIVLGGVFVPLFPWIGDIVTQTLQSRLGQMRVSVPPIMVSHLGFEAAALGAAGQVIERVIADPAALLQPPIPD
ncbi:ROK family transcriptional regulator [Acrocarpospora macrocephala]|uniref:Sugar kinase n=1 Tax=Acrocarpospora macrocephala TaxID=150177 RepID=A0A5M3X3S7_9ACTN|nr:ROK family transcriptional regulator [Acrocarpospora macrocephala]GES15784.1 sugar kinase [Acrocarpospora macrocephala]